MPKLALPENDRIRRLDSPTILRTLAWSLVIAFIILAAAGLTLQARADTSYADLGIPLLIIALIPAGLWLVVSALVVSRHPHNPVGWLLCLAVIGAPLDLFSAGYITYDTPARHGSLAGVVLALIWLSTGGSFSISNTAFTLMLLLFPDGHLPSPRWKVVGWMAVAAQVLFTLLKAVQPGPVDPASDIFRPNPLGVSEPFWSHLEPFTWIAGGIMVLSYAAATVSLMVRLRQARGQQRQQIKWLLYPAALFGLTLPLQVYSVVEPSDDRILGIALAITIPPLIGILIAVPIAIFKYRLYDIDVIINRSLVYGALSGALALVYFVTVVLLQWILPAESPVVAVVSTLAVIALFSPLRRRIQDGIDRRFYRSKYDARQILDSFQGEIKDEVELERLSQALLAVVDQTLRPAHISLWLKEDNQ